MRDKFFLITIDTRLFKAKEWTDFHSKFSTAIGVLAWWSYLDGTYIIRVRSQVTSTHISELINELTSDKLFLVAGVVFQDYNGRLPQEAWDWIRDQMRLPYLVE